LPLQIPSLKAITDRLTNNIESALGIATQRPATQKLKRRVTQILGIVIGGAIYLLYLFLREVGKQPFINYADEDGLYALGDEYGITRKEATKAAGNVIPTNTAEAIIPSGTQVQNAAGGLYVTTSEVTVQYVVVEDITFDTVGNWIEEAGTSRQDGDKIVLIDTGLGLPEGLTEETLYYVRDKETDKFRLALTDGGAEIDFGADGNSADYKLIFFIPIEASSEGSASNLPAGDNVYLLAPIAGLDQELEVASTGIYGGTDLETLDNWRERLSLRKKNPPSGGSRVDYLRWVLEYPGITRAWLWGYELSGPGTVTVAFVNDIADPIVPTAEEAAAVKAYLIEHEDPATGLIVGIPVTDAAGLTVIILNEVHITMTIDIPADEDTPTVKAGIILAAKEYVRRDGGPGQTLYRSRLSDAISSVPGETRHRISSFPFDGQQLDVSQVGIVSNGDVTFQTWT
jgi:uncharacterized phage protein gp47/JayE